MEEQNNYEIKEPKKKNTSTIIFTIIFIILIGVIGYLTFTRVMERSNKQNNQESSQQKQESPKKEIDAKENVKIDILTKTNKIFSIKDNSKSKSINYTGNIVEILEKLSLNDDNKIRIAVNASKKHKVHTSKNKLSNPEVIKIIDEYIKNYTVEEYFTNEDTYFYAQYDGEEVERNYKELFGEQIEHRDFKDACPFEYYYDSKSNEYFSNNQCGGTGYDELLYYFDKVTTKDDESYAYIYIGLKGNGRYTGESTKIYSDIDKKNIVEEITDPQKGSDYLIEDNKIDEFAKYKLTYKLNDLNQYYFDKIEKCN
ncbi:MAG: hypothetical protein E7159_02010 [Firmicutes bacterium]|nr:hypothetical protein [Bacillota bacterium]